MREALPDLANDFGEASRALCLDRGDGRWLCLLRKARTDSVAWAGARSKTIDISDGTARLSPRGSFSLYKEMVQDTSYPWLNQDIKLLEGISLSLMAANHVVLSSIKRQQDLMLTELNHRVRNILSLVRSISRQARSHNASLESYSAAREQRMNALATAHDLASSGKQQGPVSVQRIIRLEAEPYHVAGRQR